MSLHDDDELPPDIAALFAAERRRDDAPSPGAQQRVQAALAASIALGVSSAVAGSAAASATASASSAATTAATTTAAGAGTAAAATTAATGGALAKGLALAFATAIAGTTGAGVWLATRDAPAPVVAPAHEAAPVVVDAAPVPSAPPVVAAPVAEPEPPAVEPAPAPRRQRAATRAPVEPAPLTPAERTAQLQAERAILDEARAAVGRGDGEAAWAALARHEDAHGAGLLTEEREALRVLALWKLERDDEARAKTRAFHARWPRSLFRPALDDAAR